MMKNSDKSSILFVLILAIAVSLFAMNSGVNAQTLHIEKKIPTIEEIVSKVSLDEVVRMHDKLVSFGNRNTFSDTVSSTWGMGAARRWIYSEFMKMSEASGGRLQVYYDKFELDMPTNFRNDDEVEKNFKEVWGDAEKLEVSNVVAVLPGRTDDIRFIVNGHMDSRARHSYDITTLAPGAVDDASGTIVMMELARVLSQYEFDHTLVFSADTGEEQGLYGANHMAQTALDEGWEIAGVIADDIVGNDIGGNGVRDGSGVRSFSPDPVDSKSRHWSRYTKYVGEPYVPGFKINLVFRLDRYGRGGDHSAFTRRGFPGTRFTELNEHLELQHRDGTDLVETASREYMTKVARIQAAILGQAANAPKGVTMLNPSRTRGDYDYSTTLQWTHDTKETDIAGFKVFIRKTDSGYWQEIVDVGMVEKQQLGGGRGGRGGRGRGGRGGNQNPREGYMVKLQHRSVDDYIFGVAAYDTEGYIGIVATYDPPQTGGRGRGRGGQ